MERFCELYKKYVAGRKYLDAMAGQEGVREATDRFLERVIIPMRDIWHSASAQEQQSICAAMDAAEAFGSDTIKIKKTIDNKDKR